MSTTPDPRLPNVGEDASESVQPISEFTTQRRVEFADTDMARIVHFSRFFDFMEAAEHEFLRTLLGDDRQVHFEHEGHEIGWPRGRVQCEFHSPAKLGDLLDIRVRVVRKGSKSLTYRFDLSVEGRRVATGQITAICCRIGGSKLEAVPIPHDLASRICEAQLGEDPARPQLSPDPASPDPASPDPASPDPSSPATSSPAKTR